MLLLSSVRRGLDGRGHRFHLDARRFFHPAVDAAHAVNHFLVFILSAFLASLCASSALGFDCTAEVAIATSPLFLVPGVPLINGVIDIVEGIS